MCSSDLETVRFLIPVLKDENEYARRSAVEVLNEVGDAGSLKYLLTALKDSDWWVRSRAGDALGKIGGPRVIQAVLELARDEDPELRRSAIEILNQTKDDIAVAQLIEATHDPDWWVSERAVDALATMGRRIRGTFRGPVIGVTGSAGKTTTKEFIAAQRKDAIVVNPQCRRYRKGCSGPCACPLRNGKRAIRL